MIRRLVPWLAVWALAAVMSAITTAQSLDLYREFRSAWAWDLAWNNQWFWGLAFGDGTISVRPGNFWAIEGPSVWVHTHLDPIRLLILPIYALFPGPPALIVVQNAILWWTIPAAFGLVRSESGSTRLALLAAALVPWTPQLWPLAWNDYREMELAIPFILWTVQGYRSRRVGLTALGIAGMLTCREEYGVLLACLAIVPPRLSEEVGRTFRWSRAVVGIGVAWMLLVFFAFESVAISRLIPWAYLEALGAPTRQPVRWSAVLELLAFGLGPWSLLALLSPRLALVALFWVVEPSRERWAEGMLATPNWHLVRYTAPAVALVLAAGLVGFARAGSWLLGRRGGTWTVAALWVAIAAGLLAARSDVVARVESNPRPIPRDEAAVIRHWIGLVDPREGVLAGYEVSAALSSRRDLFSYVLGINHPNGYPALAPEICWAFLPPGDVKPSILTTQGFEVVYRGQSLNIYRRALAVGAGRLSPVWLPIVVYQGFPPSNLFAQTFAALAPAVIAALWARRRLAKARRGSAWAAPASGMTGAEVAAAILAAAEAGGIAVVPSRGPLADFYDPTLREVRLSAPAFEGRSPAAYAVAAHEAGHALQGRWASALRVALVFASSLSATAGWIALASALAFGVSRLALIASLLIAASALIALALAPIESGANRRARRAMAVAGLGRIAALRGFDPALSALALAPLAAVLPFGRRFSPRRG